MFPESIIEKIRVKYGKDQLYSSDCVHIASAITDSVKGARISESTIKRALGFVGIDSPDRYGVQRTNTMDIIAKWLGYDCYKDLLREIGEEGYSSEFTPMEEIVVSKLEEGTQVQLQYMPSRLIIMTYLGNGEFVVNESKNSKLLKGDRIKLTNLVLGQELMAREVVRDGRSLGGYRAAKDGGLTSLEIIN